MKKSEQPAAGCSGADNSLLSPTAASRVLLDVKEPSRPGWMAQLQMSQEQEGSGGVSAEEAPRQRPNISKVEPSALLARLQNFLPQMELANSNLPNGEMAEGGSTASRDTAQASCDPVIMTVREDGDASNDVNESSEPEAPHVEMNLLCGVLEEKKADEPVTEENIRIPGAPAVQGGKGEAASRPCIEEISPDSIVEQQID